MVIAQVSDFIDLDRWCWFFQSMDHRTPIVPVGVLMAQSPSSTASRVN